MRVLKPKLVVSIGILCILAILLLMTKPVFAAESYSTTVNKCRSDYGLKSLKVSKELTRAATVRAEEQNVAFSHQRPDGSSWTTVSKKTYGEIIALADSIDDAIDMWLDSPTHADLLLDKDYKTFGIGQSGRYYVIEFGY